MLWGGAYQVSDGFFISSDLGQQVPQHDVYSQKKIDVHYFSQLPIEEIDNKSGGSSRKLKQ
jgi:hypothetical protein